VAETRVVEAIGAAAVALQPLPSLLVAAETKEEEAAVAAVAAAKVVEEVAVVEARPLHQLPHLEPLLRPLLPHLLLRQNKQLLL
jgi:hypothetical protein